jgi:hypothetical protein
VVGALFQTAACLVQFFALPYKFPAFALSFAFLGIGNVFQVNIIYIHNEVQVIISLLTFSSPHRRLAS